jgi:hypothetical protein
MEFLYCDLDALGGDFLEKGVLKSIGCIPSDKAPTPDGFTEDFFKACWPIIKTGLIRVIQSLSYHQTENFLNL